MTCFVTDALREQLTRMERGGGKASVEDLLAIADKASVHLKHPYIGHAEYLYDDSGLPK